MEKEVKAFIHKHHLFHKNATVLIGVSGGPDSMALLHYLNHLKEELSLRLIALAVDHGLRGEESKKDVEYVRDICKQWEIEFYETFVDVHSYKKNEGKSTQVAARELRYEYFKEQMIRTEASYLALGHHGDDQAETMVMRFVRGTNPSTMKGIPIKRPFCGGYLVRPFLCITKHEIEEYCILHGIRPRRDPSNESDAYTRNFFRIHILPLLQEKNPSLQRTMQRLSEAITEDESYLTSEAKKILNETVTLANDPRQVRFNIDDFIDYPYTLQRRAFHLILNYLYHTIPDGIYYAHEDQFFDLLHNSKANIRIDLPKDLKVVKSYQTVSFYFDDPSTCPSYSEYLPVPGNVALPDGSVITATITDNPVKRSKNVMIISGNDFNHTSFVVRTRKPGDRMKIEGLNGTKKVKDIFIDEKIPKHLRDSWPLVVDQQGNIVWLVGIKKGEIGGNSLSEKFLQLHYNKDNV